MTEIIDGQEQIVMSLGGLKAASRGALLGLETAQVYQLRTDARKSNDAVKKGIASPLSDRPAPAVTAGSSPESRNPSTSSVTSAKEAAIKELNGRIEELRSAKGMSNQRKNASIKSLERQKLEVERTKANKSSAPAVTAGSSPESRTDKSKPPTTIKAKKPTATAKTPAVSSKPSPEKRLSSDPTGKKQEFFKVGQEPFAIPNGSRAVVKKRTPQKGDVGSDTKQPFLLVNDKDGKKIEKAVRMTGKLGSDRTVKFTTQKAADAWAKKANAEIEKYAKMANP